LFAESRDGGAQASISRPNCAIVRTDVIVEFISSLSHARRKEGRKELFYPYWKTFAQSIREQE
jgi:hypothetical protein